MLTEHTVAIISQYMYVTSVCCILCTGLYVSYISIKQQDKKRMTVKKLLSNLKDVN